MSAAPIGKGLCLGLGATNARVAICDNDEIKDFEVEKTPSDPDKFFKWMADEIVKAHAKGAEWAVVGLPGLVAELGDKHSIGPSVNIPPLSDHSRVLEDELIVARPEIKQMISRGFVVIAVNDGLLSAYAAANLFGEHGSKKHQSVASFIIGTGVGGAIVRRVGSTDIFKPDEGMFEIGHLPLIHDHETTFETTISGPSIHKRHGKKAEELESDPGHQVWQEIGQYMGQLIMMMSLIAGVEVVVACGGVGSNSYARYKPHLEEYMSKFRKSPNAVHRVAVPDVIAVSPENSQKFEMYGAQEVMKYHNHTQA